MRGLYSVAAVRAAEDEAMAVLPAGALMQRAATALAVMCSRLLTERVGGAYGARVTLLVGSGNNGGDALFAGAALARRGTRVVALLSDDDRVHAAGLAALRLAGGRVSATASEDVDLVIDGLLGIGGRDGLRGRGAELAESLADAFTVSVDLPSGVDAETGAVQGEAVRADVTVTFGCLKPGLVLGAGAENVGELHLVDIGLDLPTTSTYVLEAADVRALLPEPTAVDDKYTRGVVGVVAGSPAYPGAGALATAAALHGGGMVRYLGRVPELITARYPEVVVQSDQRPADVRVQAWVIGPGAGTDADAVQMLEDVLSVDVPVLVDADAITMLAERRELLSFRHAPTVVTPHDREFARLCPELASLLVTDRLAAARGAAELLGAVVLLKGNATIVADPAGIAYVNSTGTPWLATAGSGDVLAGLIGSLLAAGLPAGLAATAGAYVHGVAGQIAGSDGPPTSADILAAVRPALRSVARG